MATFLVTGLFGGVFTSVASAATSSFTLTMTSGAFGVGGNPPATLPTPGSITGQVSATTGDITGATLTLSPYHTTNTGSTETIFITQANAGTATGAINSTGDVSFTDTLSALVTIHAPVHEQCLSTPIHVILQSTAPYDASTHDVTVSQTNFTIPIFPKTSPAGTCTLAGAGGLNTRFAGSSGNIMTLALHGTLPIPPPPAAATTTSLTATPPSPVLTGVPVTLDAAVSSSGHLATGATGSVKFMSGATQVGGTQTLVGGKASLTTATLPVVPGQSLTAVYSGDSTFAASTSAPVSYSVQPKPTVSLSLPTAVIRGASTPTQFSITVANPSTGATWTGQVGKEPQLWVKLAFTGISAQKGTLVALTYESTGGTWCPITLTGRYTFTGIFKGDSGACGSQAAFSLSAGETSTITLRVKYAPLGSNNNYGTQRLKAILESVSGGTVVAPLTGNAAPNASGSFGVNPSTRYPVTLTVAPQVTPIPRGYALHLVGHIAVPPALTTGTTTLYAPGPGGTMTYIVDGVAVATGSANGGGPTELLPTAGLSPGSHSLLVEYSGDGVYDPTSYVRTFTVGQPLPGATFTCRNPNTTGYPASVLAVATVPATTTSGSTSLPVTALSLTLNTTPGWGPTGPVKDVAFGLSPGGTISTKTDPTKYAATPTRASGNTSLTWSGLSTSVPITGNVGTVVNVGISSVSFFDGSGTNTCTPVSKAASLATVTVSGVTLAASPVSPVSPGTTVTLTATAVPATKGGQVTFFEHITATHKTVTLGTAVVPTSAPTKGVAKLTLQPALGSHSYHATWSGTVPASTSNTVVYSVETAPVVTKQPATTTVNLGSPLAFSAAATGNPVPTAAWQQSTDGGSTWAPAVGTVTTKATGTTTTSTLTIPSATKTDGSTKFRAVFTNAAGTATTNAATSTVVIPPTVVTQPANQSVVAGSTGTFTAKATGTVLSVQWQVSTDGGKSWSNAPGTPKNTFASGTTLTSAYTTPATTTASNGAEYQAVFSNGAGTATSNAATLTVSPAPVAPTVTTQPASGTVNAGTTAVFGAAASGLPTPSVQWQVSTNGGSNWATVPGATSSLLVVSSVPGTDNGNQYRVVFTNSAGSATSNPATLTVTVNGYRLVASNGSVFAYGDASFFGSMGGITLNAPIVGTATTPSDGGYWLVASDGGIFAFGNAHFYGSMGGQPLNKPIVGMAATPTGGGYWEVASDGGIFAFGNAAFYGSTGSMALNKPIVGMAATPTGGGYWLVASDGGIFAFGNAAFYGSTGSMALNKPIVGMAATPTGGGYWLVASDGGIFSFGNAQFHGTVAGTTSTSIVSITPTTDGGGYWETASNGQVFQFGDATSAGTAVSQGATVVAMSE